MGRSENAASQTHDYAQSILGHRNRRQELQRLTVEVLQANDWSQEPTGSEIECNHGMLAHAVEIAVRPESQSPGLRERDCAIDLEDTHQFAIASVVLPNACGGVFGAK